MGCMKDGHERSTRVEYYTGMILVHGVGLDLLLRCLCTC